MLTTGVLALWELSLSGIMITGRPLYLTLSLFLVAALVEGAITVAALRAIARLSPDVLHEPSPLSFRTRFAIAALAVTLVTGGFLMASAAPDGLQQLAGQLGLHENPAWEHAPFAGYEMSGFGADWLGKPAAGMVGLVCAFAICTIGGKKRQQGV